MTSKSIIGKPQSLCRAAVWFIDAELQLDACRAAKRSKVGNKGPHGFVDTNRHQREVRAAQPQDRPAQEECQKRCRQAPPAKIARSKLRSSVSIKYIPT